MKNVKTIYEPDLSELSLSAVKAFFGALKELSDLKEKIVVSLPGGRSVRSFFSVIAEKSDLLPRPVWTKVHLFWTDERLVSPEANGSNYGLAEELFLKKLRSENRIEEDQIHRFPGEKTNVSEALIKYRNELRKISGGIVHLPVLGVGSDGHVGSLFPDRSELSGDEREFLLVQDSPKPPKKRITISPSVIRKSFYPFLFFLGEEKREAYECFNNSARDYVDCPCKLALSGDRGTCFVITDMRLAPDRSP
ncbi:MAG: 6-phosphogluconolactonase [Candidatus Bipolaricaulia bacterium]